LLLLGVYNSELFTLAVSNQQLLTTDIVILAFVVCGGIFFELLKLVPAFWNFVIGILARLGVVGKDY
jgi:hypothetical protein